MTFLALQMSARDPLFWIMVVIAASFIVIAIAMVAIAVFVNRAVKSVGRLESKMEPLIERVSDTAVEARDKVELVSRTIDRTNRQVALTTDFIQTKVIEPARELAAIMAGFRRGLEVLVAPMPKPINQTYSEDEMFIG